MSTSHAITRHFSRGHIIVSFHSFTHNTRQTLATFPLWHWPMAAAFKREMQIVYNITRP